MKKGFNILKNYIFYVVILLFLEISFSIIMSIKLSGEGLINRLLFTLILSGVFALISNIFNKKVNRVITALLLFILGLLYSIQCVFYNSFKTYFSLSNLGLSDQITSFMNETIRFIMNNIIAIIIFFIPFVLYLIFKKKINNKQNNKYNYITYIGIILISTLVFIGQINLTKGKIHGTYELYHDINEVSLNINKLGVMNSYIIDLHRTIFGFKTKISDVDIDSDKKNNENENKEVVYKPNTLDINFDKETSNNKIKTINEYMKNTSGSMKNKYTGIFKGYNLIYITAESFSELGVSQELTPTLYKLTHSGFIFDKYYTPNALSTIGGEFQSLTGLFPDNSILPTWRSGTNYFPNGLGTTFKNLGYTVHAYHNHNYYFQNRHVYYESQGLTPFKACKNGLENQINCHIWPESDLEMINATFDEYKDTTNGPFFTYFMTVSGHFEYDFKGNNTIAKRHKSEVEHLTNLSEAAQAYVATQIELDRALESLLQKLEENNLLDNTVIVLLADHYPYELSMSDVNSLSSYVRDDVVEVNHNNLIIWNNKLENVHINKPCMSSDVVPTVYNLFGIDFDSRLFTGRDILSTSSGLAIMKNHSWVTDKGTYFARENKFVGDSDVDDNYIRTINDTVNNRLEIGKLILETDYYKYLLK